MTRSIGLKQNYCVSMKFINSRKSGLWFLQYSQIYRSLKRNRMLLNKLLIVFQFHETHLVLRPDLHIEQMRDETNAIPRRKREN